MDDDAAASSRGLSAGPIDAMALSEQWPAQIGVFHGWPFVPVRSPDDAVRTAASRGRGGGASIRGRSTGAASASVRPLRRASLRTGEPDREEVRQTAVNEPFGPANSRRLGARPRTGAPGCEAPALPGPWTAIEPGPRTGARTGAHGRESSAKVGDQGGLYSLRTRVHTARARRATHRCAQRGAGSRRASPRPSRAEPAPATRAGPRVGAHSYEWLRQRAVHGAQSPFLSRWYSQNHAPTRTAHAWPVLGAEDPAGHPAGSRVRAK